MAINISAEMYAVDGYEAVAECQQDETGVSFIDIAATVLGFVIAFVNFVVVTLIAHDKNLHKATYVCICNLAIADLLTGLLLAWIFGLQKIALPMRTPLSEMIQKSIWVVTVWSSMLNQLVIALHRYFAIQQRNPSSRWGGKNLKLGTIIGLMMTWIIPLLLFVAPVTTTWNCVSKCSCFKSTNDTSDVYYMFCFPLQECSMTNPPFTKSTMLYLGLFLIVMPIIPFVVYIKIFKIVNQSRKNCRSKNSFCTNSSEPEMQNLRSLPILANRTDESVGSNHQLDSVSCTRAMLATQNKARSLPNLIESINAERRKSNKNLFSLLHFSKHRPDKKSSFFEETEQRNIRTYLRKASSAIVHGSWHNMSSRDTALLRTLVLILACYTISTLPLGVVFTISYGEVDKRYVTPTKILLFISIINSLINPIIYMRRFKDMQKAFKKVFCCC